MAEDNKRPIIIKKVKAEEHASHGGAWKVAYADFVTAMMAFFLLLWLLNATTEEQKKGIAEYFTPASVAKGKTGAGGLFGGVTMTKDGPLRSAGGPREGGVTGPTPAEPAREDPNVDAEDEVLGDGTLQAELAEKEAESFEQAAQQIRLALQSVPELAELKDSLLIDKTPEGLRIQLVDQDRMSMFASGSASPLEHTRRLLQLVTDAVKNLPNKLSITGHTDAVPFRGKNDYSNWELSADRANGARRQLLEGGLDPSRIYSVQGKSDTEPLIADDPTAPQNRRVSIVLLREVKPPRRAAAIRQEGDRFFDAAPPAALRAPTTNYRKINPN